MLRVLLSLFLLIIAVGCGGPRYVDYFPNHDDGAAKPSVAVIPVVNASDAEVPWDISTEITKGIRYKMMDDGELYLLSMDQVRAGLAPLGQVDFFSNSISYPQYFPEADFAVIIEVIEHKTVPYDHTVPQEHAVRCHLCNQVLAIKVRVKVIDLRCRTPRIVLQEIISNSVYSRPENAKAAEKFIPPGPEACVLRTFGEEHERTIGIVVKRLETVIRQAY